MVCLWGLDLDLEVCLPLDLEWDVDIHHHLVVLEDMLLRLDQEGLVECLLNRGDLFKDLHPDDFNFVVC